MQKVKPVRIFLKIFSAIYDSPLTSVFYIFINKRLMFPKMYT